MEGFLLLRYLTDAPADVNVQRLYVQAMHLYDCQKRREILRSQLSPEDIQFFDVQAAEIRGRIEGIKYFQDMPEGARRRILRGEHMMITEKAALLDSLGFNRDEFNHWWNILSQYSHMLSFTFYRMEPEGRGTGMLNAFDLQAMTFALQVSSSFLNDANVKMVEIFPDVEDVMNGIDSKFSPGPVRNLPRHKRREIRKPRRG